MNSELNKPCAVFVAHQIYRRGITRRFNGNKVLVELIDGWEAWFAPLRWYNVAEVELID